MDNQTFRRLCDECCELAVRVHDLRAFIGSPEFLATTQPQQDQMTLQLGHMAAYQDCLTERIKEELDAIQGGE